MSYFQALGIDREPFSTSPDPRFFYLSQPHQTALKRLEIAIRLRRGLCVVCGDVGTGKTTLSRTLIQLFNNEPGFSFHMLLDPHYVSEFQFLASLLSVFEVRPRSRSTLDYRNALKDFLFHTGVIEGKVPVLIVDEGQKLAPSYLEQLRVLLNYETNEFKLLQVLIFAQNELLPILELMPNFCDRVCFQYTLRPLTHEETCNMIDFRLRAAGYHGTMPLFSKDALREIHQRSRGYPRRITMLCHDALEALVMYEKHIVDQDLLEELMFCAPV